MKKKKKKYFFRIYLHRTLTRSVEDQFNVSEGGQSEHIESRPIHLLDPQTEGVRIKLVNIDLENNYFESNSRRIYLSLVLPRYPPGSTLSVVSI